MSNHGLPQQRLPLTFLLPECEGGVLEIHDQTTGLRMSVVAKDDITELSDEWSGEPGVYLLLGNTNRTGVYTCYVGRSTTLRSRVHGHAGLHEDGSVKHGASPKSFAYAVLVRRICGLALSTTQLGWLEARLYQVMRHAKYARMENSAVVRDEPVADHEVMLLERLVDLVRRVLATMRYSTRVGAKAGLTNPFDVTLLDLVLSGYLDTEVPIIPIHPGLASDDVEPGELTGDGNLSWAGQPYRQLYAAAKAVIATLRPDVDLSGKTIDGWAFWGVHTLDGPVSLGALRERFVAGHPSGVVQPGSEPAPEAPRRDEPTSDEDPAEVGTPLSVR